MVSEVGSSILCWISVNRKRDCIGKKNLDSTEYLQAITWNSAEIIESNLNTWQYRVASTALVTGRRSSIENSRVIARWSGEKNAHNGTTEKTIFNSLVVCEEKKSCDGDNRRLHWTIGGLERVDGRCAIEILGKRNQSADGVKSTRDACDAIDGEGWAINRLHQR